MRRSRLFFTTSMGSKCNDDPNMPQVGMIVTHKVGRWKVLRNIATGPFSDVFIIADVENSKRKFAMKCEKQEGNTRPVLKLDVLVLMSVKGAVGFPLFIAAGRTSTYRYCVMQLVGPDLGKLRRSLIDKRLVFVEIKPQETNMVDPDFLSQQLYEFYSKPCGDWKCCTMQDGSAGNEYPSSHCRGTLLVEKVHFSDVKAPNFAIGIGSESGVIYMLDFGFARKYKEANGEIIPPRSAAALLGTFQYTPLASHDHKDQAPKDDLESWFYMAAELLKGIHQHKLFRQPDWQIYRPLPWCKIDGHKEHQTIAAQKKLIRRERRAEFMEGMPSEFDRILTMIDNMGFYDRPPYTLFQSLIEQAAKKLRITLHEPFDWQVNARVLKKAEFVGELGESNLASMKMGEEEEETDTSVDTTPIDIET
ncbi:hypothetical protein ANCCEY_04695 [Ancylostoma ceylanicum]|uniref:Protein kinase domain-containing protein n=1 Tax=Ancylostoma ceylanicum TaxID=53326 RepID=A0A0D6M8K6_9BILA|nr:hypothetical protein ANCCEY_04695 [Ancylostoma ceylanicum]